MKVEMMAAAMEEMVMVAAMEEMAVAMEEEKMKDDLLLKKD
jgi:hypothetical protein